MSRYQDAPLRYKLDLSKGIVRIVLMKMLALAIITFWVGGNSAPSCAQDSQQIIGAFGNIMNMAIEQARRQEEIDRVRNSPEVRNAEIQPGGLSRGKVIILQQLLITRGYDVGAPDGVIGAKTMAVVAQLQSKAGVEVTGYPTQQLLDALLSSAPSK